MTTRRGFCGAMLGVLAACCGIATGRMQCRTNRWLTVVHHPEWRWEARPGGGLRLTQWNIEMPSLPQLGDPYYGDDLHFPCDIKCKLVASTAWPPKQEKNVWICTLVYDITEAA